jgi:hypothetical protein
VFYILALPGGSKRVPSGARTLWFPKRRIQPRSTGERGWVKIKNRDYLRYEMERESAINKRRVKRFV